MFPSDHPYTIWHKTERGNDPHDIKMYSLEEQITTKHELKQPRYTPNAFHSTNNLQKKSCYYTQYVSKEATRSFYLGLTSEITACRVLLSCSCKTPEYKNYFIYTWLLISDFNVFYGVKLLLVICLLQYMFLFNCCELQNDLSQVETCGLFRHVKPVF